MSRASNLVTRLQSINESLKKIDESRIEYSSQASWNSACSKNGFKVEVRGGSAATKDRIWIAKSGTKEIGAFDESDNDGYLEINESLKSVNETAEQWWIVEQGTKNVINGPYSSMSDASKELVKAPIGGTRAEVVSGVYLGNNMLESSENIKPGAFHQWLGKSEDEPITDTDIEKGIKAGGHPEKMAIFARNERKWDHK